RGLWSTPTTVSMTTLRTPRIPTASLADVAFLLLAFFLVATAFQDTVGLPATLPPKTSHAGPPSDRLTVQVSASGAVAVEGEVLSPAALRARVAAAAPSGPGVSLHAHAEAPYAAYVAALDAVLLGHRDAGVPPRLSLPQPVW
ncbi:MAG: biopolymer transporter ExbD, partial [Bacteroidota bacterium]